jgi:hypothetical protein
LQIKNLKKRYIITIAKIIRRKIHKKFRAKNIEVERCENNVFFEFLKYLPNSGFGVAMKKLYEKSP